jgi:hypothetical protein
LFQWSDLLSSLRHDVLSDRLLWRFRRLGL